MTNGIRQLFKISEKVNKPEKNKEAIERTARRIKKVMEETGWSAETVKQEFSRAAEHGVSEYYYMKCKGWMFADDLEALVAAATECKRESDERKKEFYKQIAEATNWNEELISEKTTEAKKYGVNLRNYVKYHGWDLDNDELKNLGKTLAKKKKRVELDRKYFYTLAKKRSGWEDSRLIEDMEEKRKQGISYMRYAQKDLWALSEDESAEAVRNLQFRQTTASNTAARFIPKICEETGWSEGKALLEIERSRVEYGTSAIDYYQYRMWETSFEDQKLYITWGLMQKFRIENTAYIPAHVFFDDKQNFNRTFSDMIHRRWFVMNKEMSFKEFQERIHGLDSLIVKPIGSSGGSGVKKVSCGMSENDDRELYGQLLSRNEKTIIEECIIQHPSLMKIEPHSVNTVRIVTLNHEGECKFLMACLRIGTGGDVDNLHSGGISVEIDVNTGVVLTDGIDYEGRVYTEHPISKVHLRGFQVPHWNTVLMTCREMYNRVAGVNLIGWDFAITPNGVDVVEGNAGSGYDAMQMPHVATFKSGLRSQAVDPYFAYENDLSKHLELEASTE